MRVVLVDDHTLFREALASLLEGLEPEISIIEAANAEEAISATEHYRDLDLILLDLAIPGCHGLELFGTLKAAAPQVPIVILSGENNPGIIKQALESGARGFIPKTSSSQGMINALRLVFAGETYVPLTLLSGAGDDAGEPETGSTNGATGLTSRQLEVLELLSQGLPNKLIARRLDLSEGTIKLHVSAILRSLGAQNRTEAVREAGSRGILAIEGSTD